MHKNYLPNKYKHKKIEEFTICCLYIFDVMKTQKSKKKLYSKIFLDGIT